MIRSAIESRLRRLEGATEGLRQYRQIHLIAGTTEEARKSQIATLEHSGAAIRDEDLFIELVPLRAA